MKKTLIALTLFALAASGTCQAKNKLDALCGEWRVAEIFGNANTDKSLMLGFNIKEHRIFGNAGCNTFFALITNAKGSKISFGQPGATRMACPNNDNYEYVKAVSEVTSFKINKEKNTVELKKNGKVVLKLYR